MSIKFIPQFKPTQNELNDFTRLFDIFSYQLAKYPKEKAVGIRDGKNWKTYSTQEAVENINHVHLLAQYEFVKANSWGRDLDRVFRFESLSEYVRFLWGGLGKETPYPNLKSTGRLHYREYYDVALRERVAVRYKQDIELFGYEF